MKRTNVVIDDELIARARTLTGLGTTRDVLDRALSELVAREEHIPGGSVARGRAGYRPRGVVPGHL